MKMLVAVSLVIVFALLEGLLPLVVIWKGLHIPFVIIALSWTTLWVKPAMWPWLGLIAGIVLDMTMLNPIGSLSIFYIAAMYLMYLMKTNEAYLPKTWWTQILISAVIAFMLPWYLLLVNGQFGLASSEVALVSLKGAIAVAVMVAVPLNTIRLKGIR